MIKTLYFILLLCVCVGCNSISEQNKNTKPVKTGDIEIKHLLSNEPTFGSNYQQAMITSEERELVVSWPSQLSIDIYFGTWCHDSEREVPKLLKLLSLNPNLTPNLIGLNYKKSEPKGRAVANGVKFTPTIVVRLGGMEIGRIIERPTNSLALDIEQFIKKHNG